MGYFPARFMVDHPATDNLRQCLLEREAMSKKGSVFANKSTRVFHRADKPNDACRKGEIKKENQVDFASAQEASRAGYTACQLCYPDDIW